MRWSKLKQQIESGFTAELRGRVELHTTRYAKAHDRFGRSWITIDGREIINMCNYLPVGERVADGNAERFAAGVFAGYDLADAMREYLNLPIDTAIASQNPLVRALAVLDRRFGKRRIAKLNLDSELPMVRDLAALRMKATA